MPLNYISRSIDFARCRCDIDLRGVLVKTHKSFGALGTTHLPFFVITFINGDTNTCTKREFNIILHGLAYCTSRLHCLCPSDELSDKLEMDAGLSVHDTLPKTTSPKRHFAETTQCRKFFSGATLRRKFLMINNESCLREINVI